MKTFINYITEIYPQSGGRKRGRSPKFSGPIPLTKVKSTGHVIYKESNPSWSNRADQKDVTYYGINPKKKTVDIEVSGLERQHPNGTKTFYIDSLEGSTENNLKAHHFYRHIMKHDKTILYTDTQTAHGKRVWDRLARIKDVVVHGWDPKSNKRGNPVDVTPAREYDQDLIYPDNDYDHGKITDRALIAFYRKKR